MYEIETPNLDATVARLNLSADKVDDATEAGVIAVTEELALPQAEKQIGRIYKRKIPTRHQVYLYYLRKKNGGRLPRRRTGIRAASNAPAWKRRGWLQRGLKPLYPNRRTGVLDIQGTPAYRYAEPRHNLNKPGAMGVTRHDPFFESTERIITPQVPETFENAFLNELDI